MLGGSLLLTGGDFRRFPQILHAFSLLFLCAIIIVVVGFALFFLIRALFRSSRNVPWRSSHSVSPSHEMRVAPDSAGRGTSSLPIMSSDAPSQSERASVPLTPIRFSGATSHTPASIIDKLRATDWYQFERVVGLIYESRGFCIARRGGQRPDGGIDLLVEKDGVRAAVQCKRWKKWVVKEPLIRELLGAMTHEGLTKGIVVSLNGFTYQAKQLAIEHNIELVDDQRLAGMIDELSPEARNQVIAMLDDETKHCPICEAAMIWREPKPGGKQFKPFWGCSRYSQGCRGKLQDD